MKKERIGYLLQQYMNNALSREERQELSGILQKEPEQVQAVIAEIMEQQTASPSFDKAQWGRMLEKILSMDKPADRQQVVTRQPAIVQRLAVIRRLRFRWAAAAAVLILISGGVWLWLNLQPALVPAPVTSHDTDILPGGNKATLTLEDGSRLILDDAKKGELFSRGSTVVNKTSDGEVEYQPAAGSEQLVVTYNTLSTPRGGQYRIVLPDGTRVWLNAASSLKYPTAFTGTERRVELSGEGYFEVAEDRNMPFRVQANGVNIAVLGTYFNVMAYDNEERVETTLLRGSVEISRKLPRALRRRGGAKAESPLLIYPGQQASLDKATDNLKVTDVDIEAYVAWKNGYFMFTSESIQGIMRKVARWYDVEIEYQGAVTGERFGGTISRFENVSEVLEMLELTGLVHFKVEASPTGRQERRIIVMSPS